MNGSLGRDRVWNDHIWSEIDQAVRQEIGRIRVAQKVFPSLVVNNVLPISTSRVGPPGFIVPPPGPALDVFAPFFEISTQFVLTQAQVDGEENVRLAASFARSAASQISAAEDALLFFGPAAMVPPGINVTNQPVVPPVPQVIPPGIVAEAAAYPAIQVPPVPRPGGGPPPVNPGDLGEIMTAVAQGIAALNARAQPGPYALFVPPVRFAQIFAPVGPGLLQTPGDQLNHVVTGGLYMVNSLAAAPAPPFPNDVGILVSLGGEPAKIILGSDAMTAFTFTNAVGNYHFRVFEPIQMVVRDGRAFQTIQFL
jgi:uncharacterized linocin/CFP29 family protein